jgi:hypothetical protein
LPRPTAEAITRSANENTRVLLDIVAHVAEALGEG